VKPDFSLCDFGAARKPISFSQHVLATDMDVIRVPHPFNRYMSGAAGMLSAQI
jgi:hypothetical protein